MKIREGFVSNSSTSSFCIYGTMIGKDELIKRYKAKHPEYKYETDPEYEYDERQEMYEIIDLANARNPWEDDCFIGDSLTSMGLDETRRQFQERVEKKYTDLLGEGLKFSTHQEAWRDG